MTSVLVNPGVCGFQTNIVVAQADKRQFDIKLTTECELVNQLAQYITTLNIEEAFIRVQDSKLYEAVSSCSLHPSCPIPVAIIKALEVEAGIALARDITINFDRYEK